MKTEPSSYSGANQFTLLGQQRFAPFFWTQFCGAANDNIFKFALTVLVTYQLEVSWLPPSLAGLVIGALFILPYLLFSATSGQVANKYDQAVLMRFVKNLEIAIMLLAAWGFAEHQVVVLLACVFLMGTHSTLFGPVKYAYLPQTLKPYELTGGNGMVEMGTFVAILLGNVAGGLLVSLPEIHHQSVSLACVGVAIFGRVFSNFIPSVPAHHPNLKINWNILTETAHNLRLAREKPTVFHTLLGISWMWFFGAIFLSQFPSLAKEVLHGDAQVASLLLVLFSVGIGAGSLLCESLSRRQLEMGLAPLGAIGMSVFAIDLYFATHSLPAAPLMNMATFVGISAHWRVMADLLLLSLFAGIYSVPMYALIQHSSHAHHTARIIATNNIINALFMIASSLIAGAMLSHGLSIPEVILFTAVANVAFNAWLFYAEPQYIRRFWAWLRA